MRREKRKIGNDRREGGRREGEKERYWRKEEIKRKERERERAHLWGGGGEADAASAVWRI